MNLSRCDQTSNCLDESDEDGCRMIFQKDNYKKTVAPFRYLSDDISQCHVPFLFLIPKIREQKIKKTVLKLTLSDLSMG